MINKAKFFFSLLPSIATRLEACSTGPCSHPDRAESEETRAHFESLEQGGQGDWNGNGMYLDTW